MKSGKPQFQLYGPKYKQLCVLWSIKPKIYQIFAQNPADVCRRLAEYHIISSADFWWIHKFNDQVDKEMVYFTITLQDNLSMFFLWC